MITFEFEVHSDELKSEMVQYVSGGYGPSSKLINKFGILFLDKIKNKNIDDKKETIVSFFTKNNDLWANAYFKIPTKELMINHRWSVIDRAIQKGIYSSVPYLNKYDIVKVKIQILDI